MPRRLTILALLTALACPLAACDSRSPNQPVVDKATQEALAKRLAQIADMVDADLKALEKSGCSDVATVTHLDELAKELALKHVHADRTPDLFLRMMKPACADLQSSVVVHLRALRAVFENQAPSGDLEAALEFGLSSTEAKVRTPSALSVHELRIDPRGSDLMDRLQSMAKSDPDEKARTTAAWVLEQIAKSFPRK